MMSIPKLKGCIVKLSFFVSCILMGLLTYAQNEKFISGKITNSNGEPLEGVTITVEGKSTTVGSDQNGEYKIGPIPANAFLVFTSVGYKAHRISTSGRTKIDVVLNQKDAGLEEVVVVGYGTKSKATLTGSVATVSGKELLGSPAINIASSIEGLLPGATAMQTSGEPGRDNPTVLVRGMSTTGNTSPLVVVDGVPDAPGWQYINSNDIASISVLKDASAAIYGARAANGVILITTKRGTKSAPVLNYTFNQGITQPTRLPEMASSAEFAGYVNQLLEEAGQQPRYSEEEIKKFADGSDPLNYRNTDWYGAVVKKASTQSQHNLNIRGGTDNVKYSISGSYSNQESIFKKGSLNFKTYAVRSNLDIKINDYIKVGADLNASMDDGNYPAYSTASVFQALVQVPFMPVYWPNGLPSAGIEQGENPAIMVTDATGNNNRKEKRFFGKTSLNIIIPWVKGLSVDGFFSYNEDNITVKNWQKPWTVYEYDAGTDTYIPHLGGRILAPQLTQSYASTRNKLLNLKLNYQVKFGDNSIDAFIAGEQAEGNYSTFSAFRKNYISSTIDQLFAGSLADQQTGGSESESGRRNLFGRLSYGYKSKYLLDFNFRYDGSTNFAKGKQYGFFPGVSAAWRISQEKFLSNVEFIDNLKLRASWGKIGNDQIAAFQYLRLYSLGALGYNFGSPSILEQGLVAGVTPNPDVTWEVLKVTNAGLDADLWGGLLSVSVDVFKQRRSNILTTRALAIPVFTGLSLPNENIGIVENKGIEIKASTSNKIGKINYRIGANIAYNKSKIVDLSEASNIPEWQKARGHILGATSYYQAIGIFRTQEEVDKSPVFPGTKVGDLQYRDVNSDGKITAADMVMLDKTNIPQVTFGVNLSLSYSRFSLWANFAGQGNAWQNYHLNVRNAMNGLADMVNNRYTTGSMDSKYPRLPTIEGTGGGEVDGQKSDFWLWNTSYVRLKTLELGYTLPNEFLSKFRIKTVRVYLNGNNLFTLSKLKLFDPANTNEAGFYYPLMRIYNVGVNVTF